MLLTIKHGLQTRVGTHRQNGTSSASSSRIGERRVVASASDDASSASNRTSGSACAASSRRSLSRGPDGEHRPRSSARAEPRAGATWSTCPRARGRSPRSWAHAEASSRRAPSRAVWPCPEDGAVTERLTGRNANLPDRTDVQCTCSSNVSPRRGHPVLVLRAPVEFRAVVDGRIDMKPARLVLILDGDQDEPVLGRNHGAVLLRVGHEVRP